MKFVGRWFDYLDNHAVYLMWVSILVIIIVFVLAVIFIQPESGSQPHYYYQHCEQITRFVNKVIETVWSCTGPES